MKELKDCDHLSGNYWMPEVERKYPEVSRTKKKRMKRMKKKTSERLDNLYKKEQELSRYRY